MHILVTGGAGFIGSHCVEYLSTLGHQVTVIDDLSTGNIDRIEQLIVQSRVSFYESSVEEYDYSQCGKVDVVIHLAAQSSVPQSISNFKKSSINNICSSIVITDYCSYENVPLVYASSSAVYGNLMSANDEENSVDLLSPYAVDKYSHEMYAGVSGAAFGLSSIGLRLFNVYGARQSLKGDGEGVVNKFIEGIIRGDAITVNGGEQTRDFVYVKDVVEVIWKAANVVINKKMISRINVLSGRSTSIDELAKLIMRILGANIEIQYMPIPLHEPIKSVGTSRLLNTIIGGEQVDFRSLEEGIKETVEELA